MLRTTVDMALLGILKEAEEQAIQFQRKDWKKGLRFKVPLIFVNCFGHFIPTHLVICQKDSWDSETFVVAVMIYYNDRLRSMINKGKRCNRSNLEESRCGLLMFSLWGLGWGFTKKLIPPAINCSNTCTVFLTREACLRPILFYWGLILLLKFLTPRRKAGIHHKSYLQKQSSQPGLCGRIQRSRHTKQPYQLVAYGILYRPSSQELLQGSVMQGGPPRDSNIRPIMLTLPCNVLSTDCQLFVFPRGHFYFVSSTHFYF